MNEFSFNNYGLFSDANTKIMKAHKESYQTLQSITNTMAKLNSEEVFSSPIMESAMAGYNKIISVANAEVESLKTFATTSTMISNNYSQADSTTGQNLGNV